MTTKLNAAFHKGLDQLHVKGSDTPRTDALLYPNGTMAANLMEHARELEREIDVLTAEVEMLDKAYRETSRLLHLHEMGMYHKPKMQATIDTLRSQLKRAVEIASDSVGLADLDYENDKFGKVSELKQDLAKLMEELK